MINQENQLMFIASKNNENLIISEQELESGKENASNLMIKIELYEINRSIN